MKGHTYFVSFMHARGGQIAYGSAYYTLPKPLDSIKSIQDLDEFIKKEEGFKGLTIMGIHPVKD